MLCRPRFPRPKTEVYLKVAKRGIVEEIRGEGVVGWVGEKNRRRESGRKNGVINR